MKKILSLLAAISLVSVSFGAESVSRDAVLAAREANEAQVAVQKAEAIAEKVAFGDLSPSVVRSAKAEEAELLKTAGTLASDAESIVAAPGFADTDPKAALSVSSIVADVVTNPNVIAANPDAAAATAVQLAYVGNLSSVQKVNSTGAANLTQAANTVATSSALSATAQTQLQGDIQTATTIANTNLGINVSQSTVTTSVNPTVVSVSQ